MTITQKISEEQLLTLQNISQTLKKRIIRELEKLEESCSLISIENDINNKDINTILTILDTKNRLIYSIIIDLNYPFRPPKIQINFRPYYEFLKISFVPFTENLRKIHNINCLCCSTITCGDNWSPGFTINNLIKEIRSFKCYKRDLINKLLADKIKFKYLIDDIDLDIWLF
jgi:ubiquitin-protein ligase